MTEQTGEVSNPSPKLYGLDHLRALAITLVFFYHYRIFAHPAWVDSSASFSWTGVDLFFVLSGYLIAGQLFKQLADKNTIAVKEFFIKRFFRIIPPYLVIVALYFCIPVFREKESLPPLWKFLTFTQNFGLDVIHKGTFSHAWSLCIEEQFYFTLPFLLLVLHYTKIIKRAAVLPLVLLAAVIGLRFFSWYHFVQPAAESDDFWLIWYKWIYYPTYTRLDGLLTGVSIAAIMQYSKKLREKIMQYGNIIFIVGLAILTAAYFICEEMDTAWSIGFGFLIVAIGYGFFVASAISNTSFLYKKKTFITEQLASLSYAIYLSHKGVIHLTQMLVEKAGLDKAGNLSLCCCIATCILAALIMRYAIERPSLYIRNLILQKQS